MGLSVGVISLGCAKNRVDTEQMLAILRTNGYTVTDHADEAEVLIVNTCGFIESAKQESIDTLLEMAAYKQTGRCRALLATGCLCQRYGEVLLAEMPELDGILGVNAYEQLPEALTRALAGARPSALPKKDSFLEGVGRVLTTPSYSAYIKIGDGCDNRCAYCAIPLIRGGYRSRPRADVLAEIRTLTARGVKEITLIAQDTSRYGTDFVPRDSLASLMTEAAQIPGVAMLRVLYLYPDETDDALLDAICGQGNICRYLDLPVQHINADILYRMHRRGSPAGIRALMDKARARGFCLRTTLIVGFPGETAAQFDELMDFVKTVKFDRLGAFAYSPEEDTPAAVMADQVAEDEKQRRLDILLSAQKGIARERGLARVGRVERAIVVGRHRGDFVLRGEWDAPETDGAIYLHTERALREGDVVEVALTAVRGAYDMRGSLR